MRQIGGSKLRINRKKTAKGSKPLIAALISVTMLLQCFGAVTIFAAEQDADNTVQDAEPVQGEESFEGFDITFDEEAENYGFTAITSKGTAKLEDGKDGKGLSLGASRYLNMLDAPIKSGVYRYSFDFKRSGETLGSILRIVGYNHTGGASGYDDSNMFESFYMGDEISYYISLNGVKTQSWKTWKTETKKTPVPVGEWNHLDIIFDMDERDVYYIVNNKVEQREPIPYTLPEIWGLDFSVESGHLSVDNYRFEKLDMEVQSSMLEVGTELPPGYITPLYISFNEATFAYNYYSDTAEISMNLKNMTGADREFTLNYQVVDENGFVRQEKSEKLKIGTEVLQHKFTASPGRYGLYTLRVNASADGVELQTNKKRKFALIKTPPEGVINKKTNIHTLFGNDPMHVPYRADIMDSYLKAGFYGTRWGPNGWLYINNGMKFNDADIEALDYARSVRFSDMITLSGSRTNFNHVPVTEQELAEWYQYCYDTALATKDFASAYEIWNEPNASGFNVNATPEQYGRCVQVAYEAVKKAYPEAKVAAISLSGTGANYVERVLKVAADYMDAVAIHPYMWMQGPESGGMVPQCLKIREVMNKYGMEDKELWFTEIGWYAHVGMDNMAAYTVEMFVLNEVYNMADRIYVFRYIDGSTLPRETFGLLNSLIDYEPFMARPAFLAMSAYNDLMTDCQYIDMTEYDVGQNIYRFRLRDGRDALVFWNKDENREISLSLGCDSVEVYDLYGNASTVYGVDQKYQFSCTSMPMYVVGSFDKPEKCAQIFDIDKQELRIANNDKTDISISNYTNKELSVKLNTTDDISTEGEIKIGSEQKRLMVDAGDISDNTAASKVGGNGIIVSETLTEVYTDTENGVELKIYDGDKLLYEKRLKVECVLPIDVTHYSAHFAGERWQYVTEVTNNMYDTPLSGVIEISGPKAFAERIPTWKLGTVQPGETKKLTTPVPDFVTNDDLNFVAKLVMSNGYTLDLSRELSFRSITKMRSKPTVDGVISDGEWNRSYAIEMNDKSGNYIPLCDKEFGGNSDASAKVYIQFDDENLYFAAEVTDEKQSDHPERGLWAGDSFQIATALEKSSAASYTELTIGLQDGQPKLSRSSSLVGQMIAVDIPHQLEIKRDEGKKLTTYELSIPLTEVYPANFKISNYPSLLLSVLLNDKDKEEGEYPGSEGRDGMFEYGSGIGTGKNPSQFLDFNLVR